MSTVELMIVCVCFGLAWYSLGQLQRSRRRRRRLAARRQMVAFYHSQDQDLSHVATVLVSNVFTSTLQRRSIWARTRSQAFVNSIESWDDSEWKRNFRVSVHCTSTPFATHKHASGSYHCGEESCHCIMEVGNECGV